MARALRIEYPGALHHVTSRGNERRPIFRDDHDRLKFLEFLGQAVSRFGWSVTAWVLMTNHFHLVIQTPEPNLSRGMQWLNTTYAGWFNRRHDRCGHLFQGRFKSFLVEKESYFRDLLRYVVLNPVRAGMVQRPEDYRWSSFRGIAGMDMPTDWLDVAAVLELFAEEDTLARNLFREFVWAGIGDSSNIWEGAIGGLYLGSESWMKRIRKLVESKPRSTDHPKKHRAVGRPQMHEILAAVSESTKVNVADLRTVRGGSLRRLSAWLGWNEGLLTLRSIAAALRLRSEGYVSGLIRRCEHELGRDPALLQHLDRSLAVLRT